MKPSRPKPKIVLTSEDLKKVVKVAPASGFNRIVLYDDGSGHVQNEDGRSLPDTFFSDRKGMLNVLNGRTKGPKLRRKIERLKEQLKVAEQEYNNL